MRFEAPLVAERFPGRAMHSWPPELVDVLLRNLDPVVGRAETGEGAVEEGVLPALAKGGGEHGTAAQALEVPRGCPRRDAFERPVSGEDRGRGLRSPPRKPGIPVRGIADDLRLNRALWLLADETALRLAC